jgi:hypothetical protein
LRFVVLRPAFLGSPTTALPVRYNCAALSAERCWFSFLPASDSHHITSEIALRTTREWLQTGDNASKVDAIIFCCFLPRDLELYHSYAPVFFPLETAKVVNVGTPCKAHLPLTHD